MPPLTWPACSQNWTGSSGSFAGMKTESVAKDYRLDLQYHALRLVMNDKLFLAPVKNPGKILDCGTGTGGTLR